MVDLDLFRKGKRFKVLCLGAHSDDIEIGCGGTILKLAQEYGTVSFHWVVLSSNETRKREAEKSAHAFLRGSPAKIVTVKGFRDGFFPYVGGEIKEYFETLKRDVDPDLIFTHQRSDLHQDHRLVSELTWNTFRDHLILEYEILKYDGDLGAPNIFVRLDEAICRQKFRNLLRHFPSQSSNQWFTEEAFRAIMRVRGIESNSVSGYAEAFTCRKLSLV